MLQSRIATLCLALALVSFTPLALRADGIAAVKACEADNDGPDNTARLTILPNGDPRGSDTAAALIRTARQKAKEGKDVEAIQWAALCNFADQREQGQSSSIAQVLQYLKQ